MREGPIEQLLEPAIDEARIASAWQQIRQARGDRRHARLARWSIGIAFAGAAAAVALYLAWPGTQPGPLTSDGVALAAGAVLDTPSVALDDDSHLELALGARLAVLSNEGDRFVTQLQRGRAHFDVHPGGPRRWEIETGLATVEVVGTAFTVEASDDRVVVAVERGVVMVRGERVPSRVARLTAGQHLIIETGVKTADAGSSTAPTGGSSATTDSMSASSDATQATSGSSDATQAPSGAANDARATHAMGSANDARTATTTAGSSTREHAGSKRATTAASHDTGVSHDARTAHPQADAPHARSIGQALDAADQRRAAGDPAGAAAELERALETARHDEAAGMAAFTLGRIYLEDLRAPERAASAFEQMIAIGVPYGLLEDAHARRVEALVRARRTDDAAAALAEYDRLYPRGAHHTAVHALFGR